MSDRARRQLTRRAIAAGDRRRGRAGARSRSRSYGNGTKAGMLRPVQAARSLSTRNLTGITLYSPNELIISARAGTPLAEIEATLAEHGQHIIAEPPDLAALYRLARAADAGRRGRHQPVRPAPRRLGRDARPRAGHPRGHRARRGDPLRRARAEERHRARPVQAAHRQPRHAGVITEVTLKVLPAPEAVGTSGAAGPGCGGGRGGAVRGARLAVQRLGRRLAAGGGGRPHSRAGRLRPAPSPWRASRISRHRWPIAPRRLRDDLGACGGEILDDAASRAVWRAIARPGAAVGRTGRCGLAGLGAPLGGPGVLRTLSDACRRARLSRLGRRPGLDRRHRPPPRRTRRSKRPRTAPAAPGC